MNLTTLASLAGVSVSTVSKAFSGSSEISEETKEKIFALARQHDCFDRYNKNKFSKRVIAVLVPELRSSFYANVTTRLYEEITALGGVMICSSYEFSEERKAELFHYFASYCKADGILIVGACKRLKNPFHVPAVALFAEEKNPHIDTVPEPLYPAIEDAVLHFKANGHQNIGYAGETFTANTQKQFRAALRRAGIPVQERLIKTSPLRFEEAGIQIAEEWLAEGTLPTAVFAAYDNIAIGVIKALSRHGISVPEQVSVVGIDNISVGSYLQTSLSTIGTHTPEICHYAVELLMKKLEHPFYTDPEPKSFAAEFIPRASSGPCPK